MKKIISNFVSSLFSNVLNDVKASVYKDFCSQREKKLDSCLVADLKVNNCFLDLNFSFFESNKMKKFVFSSAMKITYRYSVTLYLTFIPNFKMWR